MTKDMRLIGELAADLDVAIDACELARHTFDEAAAAGYGERDFTVVAALQAEAAGTSLARAPNGGDV